MNRDSDNGQFWFPRHATVPGRCPVVGAYEFRHHIPFSHK